MASTMPKAHPSRSTKASAVTVAADATNGITAADLQAVLTELAARVKALEP